MTPSKGARGALLIVTTSLALAACVAPQRPVAPVAPQVVVPPAPSPGEPSDIAGLKSTALREIFGGPSFVRKDGEAEMWRYDASACKAFFFLYPFGDGLLVRHVETIPRGRDMAADANCLNSLRPHPAANVS